MPEKFDAMRYNLSYQPDWSATWKNEPCTCAPAGYSGIERLKKLAESLTTQTAI